MLAILEAIVLLALAAYIGWWLARRSLTVQISDIEATIRQRRAELDDCRRTPVTTVPVSASSTIASNAFSATTPVAASTKPDDLKVVEGIGPKIEELLNQSGIYTFAQLAATPSTRIKEILDAAGPRFQIHDPSTWSQQSALARDGKWEELKKWQDELNKGRLG